MVCMAEGLEAMGGGIKRRRHDEDISVTGVKYLLAGDKGLAVRYRYAVKGGGSSVEVEMGAIGCEMNLVSLVNQGAVGPGESMIPALPRPREIQTTSSELVVCGGPRVELLGGGQLNSTLTIWWTNLELRSADDWPNLMQCFGLSNGQGGWTH